MADGCGTGCNGTGVFCPEANGVAVRLRTQALCLAAYVSHEMPNGGHRERGVRYPLWVSPRFCFFIGFDPVRHQDNDWAQRAAAHSAPSPHEPGAIERTEMWATM